MRKARLLLADEKVLVGSFSNICVVVWRGVPTLDAIERVGASYTRMRGEFPTGFAPIVIVEDGVGLPEEPVRQKMADLMDRQGKSILSMAGVQEASGFRGSAIRSVLTAINLLSTATYPRKFFASVEQAVLWVLPYANPSSTLPLSTPQVVESIAELRREHKPQAARPSR
jgi:hypothetical protein